MYSDCVIELIEAPGEILIANSLIKRFKKKNNIDFDLKINIDFSIEDSGVYYHNIPSEIFINPNLALYPDDDNESKMLISYFGYVNDYSLLGNTIHEFTHVLCCEIYPGIIDEYIDTFRTNYLLLCDYSKENVYEEIAEIIRLYILNPLILKLINKDVYDYIKKWFKSPNPTSQKHSIGLVKDFPKYIKNDLESKWGIIYNKKTNKIIKVGNDV